ncbi:B9 domain-containing protein 1 isoform X3 [Neodiprion pinetum]|uniref:B9 domain-containing protein 1 isoform X3 n=1 Tax=Neodiprion pinetum TaxID=441929 RepID=UPI0037106CDD
MSVEGEFFLSVTGSIEYANFYDIDNVYCKYGYHFGPDWSIVRGIEEGLTQMSKKSTDARQVAVWNFPLDIAFKSINPQGCRVAVYVPQSSSILQQFIAWFSGRRPELIDPTILATGGGRQLTRMISQGTITVRFNVSMKDFFKLGYSNGQQADR